MSTKEEHWAALSDLADESFISLTTFKRDGTPVSTPVWVAGDDGRLLVHSDADTWKVKRIRRDSHVRVAPCGATGKVRGEALEGEATILADTSLVDALETHKYGLMYRGFRLFGAISRRLRRRPAAEPVTIEIVPTSAPASQPGARLTDDRVQRSAIDDGHAEGGAPEPGLMRMVRGVLSRVVNSIPRWWRSRTTTKALLLAGVAAAGVYVVGDVVSGLLYKVDQPYSFMDQAISELTALGSPVRALMVTVITVHNLLLAAFAVGIWRAAGQKRSLRWVGVVLFAATALSFWIHPFFPMSSRWLERSFTDTMHETLTFVWLPIIFAAVALAAVAYRGWFRLYSIATLLVLTGFGVASGIAIQGLEQNDTPWAGAFERINAYALMAWFVVLALTVMRRSLRVPTPETAVTDRRRGPKTREASLAATSRVRVAALLLIAGLVAGPVSTHVYWMLGGTWGLYTRGVRDEVATTGTRLVAAVVVVLLVAAVLVVLARVGLWQQAFVSDRMIRFFAWALAAVFLVETVAAFTWSREHEWWLYGPVALVIGLLALVVAGSGGAWRIHRAHRTLASH